MIAVSVLLFGSVYLIIKKLRGRKYRDELNNLDIEKNGLISVSVLSEISKVKELVKTENLKSKLNSWDNTFKTIKDEKIAKLADLISETDYLIDRGEYNQVVKKIATIEMEIMSLRKVSDHLLKEIRIITESEERNRAIITKIKVMYRELQNKFENTEKDYGDIAEVLKQRFSQLDEKFQKFEQAMDVNDYILVEKIVIELEKSIEELKQLLETIPSVYLTTNSIIPSKIEETKTLYARMLRDGYPLDYLNVEYNLTEIQTKITNISNNLKKLELGDASLELKTIMNYFNSLFNDFDKEKDSKDIFRENSKKFRYKLEKVNKVVYDIYIQIDDIRITYDLSPEEINKFSVLNRNLEEINEDFKTLLEHSKGKNFAYSKLVEELEGLEIKLSRLQDDLDYQLHSITSMKDDEYRAKEQLESIKELLRKSKNKIKDYKLPIIPSNYFVELKEAQDAIKEISKELEKKPIVIKILNIRVDNARDLVFKIYNKTNDMIKSATISERVIIYGNRYRSSYPEIDAELEKATSLFYKGYYDKSLETSIKAIALVEENPIEKLGL